MLARIAMLIGGMLLLILIVPAASEGQTRFEIAAGTHYGLQQRPLTAGWIVSGGFQIDQQDFVVEGAWHRRMTTRELRFSFDDFGDDVGRQIYRSRYLMLAAGVRGGQRQGRISPFYQVLLGGISTRFRTDYEWPTAIDVEAENANCPVSRAVERMLQPSSGSERTCRLCDGLRTYTRALPWPRQGVSVPM